MRLGVDLPSSPRNRLKKEPGLGSCTQKSEGETLEVLFQWGKARAAPAYAVVPRSPLPPPHSSMLNKSLPRQV